MLAKLVGLMLSKAPFKECDGRYHMRGRSPTWHEKKDSPLVSHHSIGGGYGDSSTIIRFGSTFGYP
jgi:hypothetical protein